MSRGPGKLQRLILEMLDSYGGFYLAVLADGDFTTRYKALSRAAHKLQETGQISMVRFVCCRPKIVVCRVGTEDYVRANRKQVDRDSQQLAIEHGLRVEQVEKCTASALIVDAVEVQRIS